MNRAVNQKLAEMRLALEGLGRWPDAEDAEAHSVAGEELDRALQALRDRKADIEEEISELEKAWSEWDYDYLLKKRYLSSSLVAKLKKEREYVYGG